MKKFLFTALGCLLGLANGFFYFLLTSYIYDVLNYSVEMIFLAFIGFLVICLLNFIFYRLTRKRNKPFALSFLISAALSDLVFLVVMSGIRHFT